VLFSEPKIPQSTASRKTTRLNTSFSALQRAENSSINDGLLLHLLRSCKFQCSSASRKFLNFDIVTDYTEAVACFSALQRAENSSIQQRRKRRAVSVRFSALQRAENSSMGVVVYERNRFR